MGVADRRERERQKRHKVIVEAAAAVLAERGPDGASMDAIADRAELGKATLYYYFRTKEELHSAVIAAAAERFFVELANVRSSFEHLHEMVEALLWAYVRFCDEHPSWQAVVLPNLVHMGWGEGSATAGSLPSLTEDEAPLHEAFLGELDRLLVDSPWEHQRQEFLEFLNDVFGALGRRHQAGRMGDARERVAFYVDLVRYHGREEDTEE